MKQISSFILSFIIFLGLALSGCNGAGFSFLQGLTGSSGSGSSSSDASSDDDDSSSQFDNTDLASGNEGKAKISTEAREHCQDHLQDGDLDVLNIYGYKLDLNPFIKNTTKADLLNSESLAFDVQLICTKDGGVHSSKLKKCADTDAAFKNNNAEVRFDVTFRILISDISTSKECKVSMDQTALTERVGTGCFDPETKIRSIEQREIPIRLLVKGDKVFNPLNKKFMEVEELVAGPEELPLVELTLEGKSVKVSSTHAFITKKGVKMAMDLSLNDELALEGGEAFHPIEKIALVLPVDKKQQVINLKLKTKSKNPKDHAVLANGLVSGDLFLQTDLEKKAQKPAKAQKPKKKAVKPDTLKEDK